MLLLEIYHIFPLFNWQHLVTGNVLSPPQLMCLDSDCCMVCGWASSLPIYFVVTLAEIGGITTQLCSLMLKGGFFSQVMVEHL